MPANGSSVPAGGFNDQKDGMERQMTQLAQLGLLSRFVGMLTDSVASCHTPVTNTSAAFCADDRSLGGSRRSTGGHQPAGRDGEKYLL